MPGVAHAGSCELFSWVMAEQPVEVRRLGRTDVAVSAVGLGVMTFGAKTTEEEAHRQLDLAFTAGITLFDTAENYPAPISAETQGRAEQILGRWVAARSVRHRVVIATKVTGPGNAAGDMSHIRGTDRRLDRANITAAIEGSLRRLGTDYVDLYQLHWAERPITTLGRQRYSHIPDAPSQVPIDETLAALDELVRAGKVRHVGVANESPWGVMRYLAQAEAHGLPRIVTVQNNYNLLDRQFELGLAEIAMREQVGLLAYSPLARGFLTGKYLAAADAAGGAAGGMAARFSPRRHAATAAYVALARRQGLDPAAMALAFVRQRPFVTAVLTAASSAEQLRSNLRTVELMLPKDLVREIDAIHDEYPNPK
jgi:aryl-alcohol dehydrogenase-like predicted oxidoreductase